MKAMLFLLFLISIRLVAQDIPEVRMDSIAKNSEYYVGVYSISDKLGTTSTNWILSNDYDLRVGGSSCTVQNRKGSRVGKWEFAEDSVKFFFNKGHGLCNSGNCIRKFKIVEYKWTTATDLKISGTNDKMTMTSSCIVLNDEKGKSGGEILSELLTFIKSNYKEADVGEPEDVKKLEAHREIERLSHQFFSSKNILSGMKAWRNGQLWVR